MIVLMINEEVRRGEQLICCIFAMASMILRSGGDLFYALSPYEGASIVGLFRCWNVEQCSTVEKRKRIKENTTWGIATCGISRVSTKNTHSTSPCVASLHLSTDDPAGHEGSKGSNGNGPTGHEGSKGSSGSPVGASSLRLLSQIGGGRRSVSCLSRVLSNSNVFSTLFNWTKFRQ